MHFWGLSRSCLIITPFPCSSIPPSQLSSQFPPTIRTKQRETPPLSFETRTLPFPHVRGAELTFFRLIRSDRISDFPRSTNLPHVNTSFLIPVQVKAEKLRKEREEGKPEKKKRRHVRRKPLGPTNSAGEAIEKILQEKKISSKINYDVLKSLNASITKMGEEETAVKK